VGLVFLIAYVNVLAQAAALWYALTSLNDHADHVPRDIPILMEFIGLMLVLLPSVVVLIRTTWRTRQPKAQAPSPPG